MTDEKTETEEAVEQQHEEISDGADAQRMDLLLQALTYLATAYHVEGIGITLSVGGSQITGLLISRDTYVQQMAAQLRAAFASTPQELRDFMEEQMFTHLAEPADPADEPPPLNMIEYIHLKDARVFNGGEPIPSQKVPGLFWRGRLSAVDGFSIGAIMKMELP